MTLGFPGERVGLDIIGPLPILIRGHEFLLVMIDYFTKWTEAIPLLRQDAASVANAINRTWISRWGSPLSFHSDCGSNFESQLMQEVCGLLDVRKTHTIPYHPEGNGLVERTNRTIHNILLAFTNDGHQHDWDVHLPFCLLAYRGTTHSSTGFTPHYLWTGRDLRLPVDLRYPLPAPEQTTPQTFATKLREVIRSAHNAARITLGNASIHQKRHFDRHTAGTWFQIGDLVMHHYPIPPRGTSAKLHHPWRGPFAVLDVLAPTSFLLRNAIRAESPPFTAHFSKLKPYRGRLPDCTADSLPQTRYPQ
uniref:Gag-Pol polyprotein n=1 Tax=Schistocephalus solidus TaxID=70667 RepID=A0A0V0J4Q4_SCHSO